MEGDENAMERCRRQCAKSRHSALGIGAGRFRPATSFRRNLPGSTTATERLHPSTISLYTWAAYSCSPSGAGTRPQSLNNDSKGPKMGRRQRASRPRKRSRRDRGWIKGGGRGKSEDLGSDQSRHTPPLPSLSCFFLLETSSRFMLIKRRVCGPFTRPRPCTTAVAEAGGGTWVDGTNFDV